ncbi:MAG: hypothetical protein HFJ03_07950 [Lachnospira sp.]|nr:hypothetical protein [Lachnospira sp.]
MRKKMKYDNKTKQELIEIIHNKNIKIEEMNMRLSNAEKLLKESEEDRNEVKKILSDLKSQRKNQVIIMNQLRQGRANLLKMYNEFSMKISKLNQEFIRNNH